VKTLGTLRIAPGSESLVEHLEDTTDMMFVGLGDGNYYVYVRLEG